MNADQNWSGDPDPQEPDIILIGIERKSYYLFKGDDHLNQLLLADGDFPVPILCVHFETIFDMKRVLGESVSTSSLWGIHPEIVTRLRDDKHLVETDA